MSVWFTIPSARPVEEAEKVLKLWRQQGYKIALWRDAEGDMQPGVYDVMMVDLSVSYPGYAKAVNALITEVVGRDPSAEWFVIGGDDTEPDPNHTAEEIARDLSAEFYNRTPFQDWKRLGSLRWLDRWSTFGVMQPTGDRFAGGSIDRIAGSAWIGREFARRINQGNGPLWPEYHHMFVDEELQNVAIKYGCFWQRPDLIQLHRHFMRANEKTTSEAVVKPIPEHLVKWNTPEHWKESKLIFNTRKANGFPGSEPLP